MYVIRTIPPLSLLPTIDPPNDVPPPLRRSTDGGRTWEHSLGCTVCCARVVVTEQEWRAVTLADGVGTICGECARKAY